MRTKCFTCELKFWTEIMLILIVEDNSLQRKILNKYLSGTDYQVIEAETAEEAYKLLDTIIPDLILADIILPGENGVSFIRKLKSMQKFEQVPVIFLSSIASSDRVVEALNAGANDYITKPFDKEELLARLKVNLALKRSQDIIKKQNDDLLQINIFNSSIIDNAGEGIAIYDHNLCYRTWNRAMENMTGINAEQVIGRKANEIFPFISDLGIDKLILDALQGKRIVTPIHQFNIPHTKHEGWVRSVFVPNFDSNGVIDSVIAVVSDLTDIHTKEMLLLKQKSHLKGLFDNMNTPFFFNELIRDSSGNVQTIKIIEYNKEFERIINSNNLDPNNLTLQDLFPELSGDIINNLINVAETGIPMDFEFRCTITNKVYNTKAYSPEKDRLAIIIEDISENKRIVDELSKSENRFRSLATASPDAIFITDLSFNIKLASNAYKRIFKYTNDQNPTSFMELIDRTEVNSFTSIVDDLIKYNKLQNEVFIGRKQTGEKIFIDVSIGLLQNQSTAQPELILIARDITERKKIEFQLIEAKNRAEEASKAKSQFIANTSHEIRTPLNAIMGYADIMKQQLKDNTNTDLLNGIQKGAKKLLSIVNSILDLSKMESGHFRQAFSPFNFIQTIVDIKQIYSTKTKQKNLKFKISIADNFPIQIISDDIKLRQIITNLLDNAIKFTNEGEILFDVEFKDNGNSIDLYLIIKDTGIGIPANQQKIIFQAFHQLEAQSSRRYGGTGLGLTITQKIVEMLNGKIEVLSLLGEGSEFRVSIPNIRKAQLSNNEHLEALIDNELFTVIIISSDLEFINDMSTLLFQANIPCLAYSELNKSTLDSIKSKSIIVDFDTCKLVESQVNQFFDSVQTESLFVLTENYQDLAKSAFNVINNAEIVNKGNMSYICRELLELSIKNIAKTADNENWGLQDLIKLIVDNLSEDEINNIKISLYDNWRSIRKLMDTEEISRFSDKIIELADQIQSNKLSLYGKLLAVQIANFELDILKETFDAFESIIFSQISENY